MRRNFRIRGAAVVALLVTTAGCSGGLGNLGTLGEILAGAAGAGGAGRAQQGQVSVEIQQVDTRQQTIQVRTQEGQTGSVRYDQNTQVVYRQQQYPVTALERGDLVLMQVQQDAQGNAYVSRVEVQQSVQERGGQGTTGNAQLQQFAGQIRQIDHNRGTFDLQSQAGGIVTVTLPYNPPQATVQYFHSLRVGSPVRLEGRLIGNGRVELHRFL